MPTTSVHGSEIAVFCMDNHVTACIFAGSGSLLLGVSASVLIDEKGLRVADAVYLLQL